MREESERKKDGHPLDQVIQEDRLKVEMKQTEGFLRNNFTIQLNTHQNNAIRFADTKAGVLTGANGLVLSYITAQLHNVPLYSLIILIGGLLCLIISIIFSLYVVYPKFKNSNDKGLVYWEHIANYKREEYVDKIMKDDASELLAESIHNNYTQAIILTEKFKKLRWGFRFCIFGYIFAGIGLLVKFLSM